MILPIIPYIPEQDATPMDVSSHHQHAQSPCVSFEDPFVTPSGADVRVSAGPTMETQILRKLFNSCIRASETLNTDAALRKQLASMRDRLPPTTVSPKTGRIREWLDEREALLMHTGQLPQLWGLFPGDEITPWGTPELVEPAMKTMLHPVEMWGGWFSATRLNYWARLAKPECYAKHFDKYFRNCHFPNLMGTMGDGGDAIYLLEGNTGATSSIAELLLQSHADRLALLPALPMKWPDGSVRGLCARGGLEADITWKDAKATSAVLRAKAPYTHTMYPPPGQKVEKIEIAQGKGTAEPNKDGSYTLKVEPGTICKVSFQ